MGNKISRAEEYRTAEHVFGAHEAQPGIKSKKVKKLFLSLNIS